MAMTQIDEDELDALRQQASQAIPWEMEATRLAEALHKVAPEHNALHGESVWQERFKKKADNQISPAVLKDAEVEVIDRLADA